MCTARCQTEKPLFPCDSSKASVPKVPKANSRFHVNAYSSLCKIASLSLFQYENHRTIGFQLEHKVNAGHLAYHVAAYQIAAHLVEAHLVATHHVASSRSLSSWSASCRSVSSRISSQSISSTKLKTDSTSFLPRDTSFLQILILFIFVRYEKIKIQCFIFD